MEAGREAVVGVPVVSADGHGLVADLHGSGRGGEPAVLLLHGLSQQARFWLPVVRRMRTRPVLALDQRGHGRSDVPVTATFSVDACAVDALLALDAAGFGTTVVVGHSWGASVALALAAMAPDRIRACVLVDGGAWGPSQLGDRSEVRERLRPPELGMPADELWTRIAAGSPWWTEESREALEPTFATDGAGRIRTRIGVDRHMAVLDGLLDVDHAALMDAARVPLWVVSCEEPGRPRDLTSLPHRAVVQRWVGAVHDVPLQWPALVAGLVDQVVEGAGA